MSSDAPGEPAGNELLELSRAECFELLAACRFGRLAVCTGAGAPVVRPVNYAFDEASQSVVFRTAAGSKLHALIGSAQAAFEIDDARPRARTGWSVIIAGVTEEVSSPSEIRRLEGIGVDPWGPGEKTHWVRIRAWTVSGRRLAPAARG
jgi:nitroimidazol reductase NimA-like FMN-containing flavoprotein (pyridoxamine 5'-phosphate oxidase superfamily)